MRVLTHAAFRHVRRRLEAPTSSVCATYCLQCVAALVVAAPNMRSPVQADSEAQASTAALYQKGSPSMLFHLSRTCGARVARRELARRRLLLLWYFMRDPLYSNFVSCAPSAAGCVYT